MAGRKHAEIDFGAGKNAGVKSISPKTTINFAYVSYAFKKGYRYCCLEGSSRSGKTWAVLQWCVFACLEPKTFLPGFERESLEVLCLRADATTSRRTIWDDLTKVLESCGLNEKEGIRFNLRDMTVFFPNGSRIAFGGASDPGKLHGVSCDVAFFNEAMMISKAAVDQLEMRTRVGFIFDWNPSLNEHWIFKQGFDKICNYGADEGELAGKPKVFYAHSTYKDNLENLTAGQIASIEQYEPTPGNMERGTADRHMWEIYGLGKRGYLEGRIITPERVVFIPEDEFPTAQQWEVHGYGLDWGFSVDPTAFVECAIFNKKLYVRELLYKTGLMATPDPTLPTEESVIGHLQGLGIKKHEVIVADSARPDLNQALRRVGFCVLDAYKPGGSIENGINLMNQRRWCVTDNSFNVKFELENWCWARDRYGRQQATPGKKHNHAMDAIRYWLSTFIDSANTIRVDDKPEKTVVWGCARDVW